MSPPTASKTALAVAAIRALHQLADGDRKVLDDPIAARLLDPETLAAMSPGAPRVSDPGVRRLRTQVVLRSRYAEDRMAAAVERGLRQCVILGAGLDTFAYRQPDWARALKIIEVDHPASQADKRSRLARAGIALPDNLEFAAVDFETVSLREGLRASALDFSKPTFFSCLGVLVYLTREAVDAVFEFVAGFPHGSEIVFTFSAPRASPSPLAVRAGELGEPWRSAIERPALKRALRALGYSTISFLDRDEACRRYFSQGRSDGLAPPRRGSIAAAIVG